MNTSSPTAEELIRRFSEELEKVIKIAKMDVKSINKCLDIKDKKCIYRKVLLLSLYRAAQLCESINIILRHDPTLLSSAVIILRSLLELLLDLVYMKTDPIPLAERYIRYDIVSRYRLLKEAQNTYDYNADDNQFHKLEREYQQFKRDYCKKGTNLNYWHGLRKEEFLNRIKPEIKDPSIFKVVYKIYCREVHNEIVSLERNLRETSENAEIKPEVKPMEVQRALLDALNFIICIYDICNDEFKLQRDKEIQQYMQRIEGWSHQIQQNDGYQQQTC